MEGNLSFVEAPWQPFTRTNRSPHSPLLIMEIVYEVGRRSLHPPTNIYLRIANIMLCSVKFVVSLGNMLVSPFAMMKTSQATPPVLSQYCFKHCSRIACISDSFSLNHVSFHSLSEPTEVMVALLFRSSKLMALNPAKHLKLISSFLCLPNPPKKTNPP